MGLLKNDNGYRLLCEAYFPWEKEKEYRLAVRVKGNHMMAAIDGKVLLEYEDTDNPYLYGCIGTAVREGSHCSLRKYGWAVGNKENQTGHTIPKTERRKEYGQEWTEFIRFQNEELKRI